MTQSPPDITRTQTSATDCYDRQYGYPWYAYTRLAAKTAAAGWHIDYANFSRSGYSTGHIITGLNEDGEDKDACQNTYTLDGGKTTPLADAEDALQQHAGSWNRVVLTAGIDNTNWGEMLATIALAGEHARTFAYMVIVANSHITDRFMIVSLTGRRPRG